MPEEIQTQEQAQPAAQEKPKTQEEVKSLILALMKLKGDSARIGEISAAIQADPLDVYLALMSLVGEGAVNRFDESVRAEYFELASSTVSAREYREKVVNCGDTFLHYAWVNLVHARKCAKNADLASDPQGRPGVTPEMRAQMHIAHSIDALITLVLDLHSNYQGYASIMEKDQSWSQPE